MATVYDVAKYILEKTGAISTWKLQKLCYYSQAWALAWTGKPLFPEDFEAWCNGPVCRPLFKKHKGSYWVSEAVFGDADTDTLTADEKDTIDTVLNSYGKMEPYQLRAQTHVELPWQEARRGLDEFDRGDRIITKDSMGDYYGSL